jgi:hypothetical protein
MPDAAIHFSPSLKDLDKKSWIAEVSDLVDENGYLSELGRRHIAAFTEYSATLLVSFETFQGIQALSPLSQPLSWEMIKRHDWSSLTLVSDGDTWFRDPAVYAFFDRLVDDGFFDEFDQVLFYGAGPCGYAAAAYSVVAPGARVLAIQPQASLDPDVAEWDARFVEMRRTDFKRRYGYAPHMLEAADQAYMIYDPFQIEDAMHASLFTLPNVTKLRARNMGASLQSDYVQMEILFDLMEAAAEGSLTPARFGQLTRLRRDHRPYLRRLLVRLEAAGREGLVASLCRNVTSRMGAPRFARRLREIEQTDEE